MAIQAQNDVSNLSGTVTNIGNRVTTAEGNITNLQGRMTTAEGNITNLQGRMTTAEGNIGNLQTAVSTAQATANSAQQTATTARQQSYVLRYSSTAITDNSTIAYSTLDNTDNIKASDKIIDVDGKIFSIVSVDTVNSTVTVGSALIDLALDSNVVHLSRSETITGVKTFSSTQNFRGFPSIRLYCSTDDVNVLPLEHQQQDIRFTDKNNVLIAYFIFQHRTDANEPFRTCWRQLRLDGSNNYYSVNFNNLGQFYPENNNAISLGISRNRWKDCQTNQINGLTPSALGMPVAPSSTSYVDISGYITVLDSSSANTYTPPSNGYITFSVTGNLVQILHDYGLQGKWSVQAGNANRGFIPVLGNVEIKIYVTASTVDKFWFIPCQGNI